MNLCSRLFMLCDKHILSNDNSLTLNDRPRIHFVHDIQPINTGDMRACPFWYFNFFPAKFICFFHDLNGIINWDLIHNEDVVILGGGGHFEVREDFQDKINMLLDRCSHVISWAVGHNTVIGTPIERKIRYEKFFRLTVRDYAYPGQEYCPDVSCMAPELTKKRKIVRRIGIVGHHGLGIPANAQPLLEMPFPSINNSCCFTNYINFIGSSEIILTNSYHAAYWATLMRKKVILYENFSSKFDTMQYKPTPYSGDIEKDIQRAKIYPHALHDCREINIRLARDVYKILMGLSSRKSRFKESLLAANSLAGRILPKPLKDRLKTTTLGAKLRDYLHP